MSCQIAPLDRSHNAALLSLAAGMSTGSEAFRVDRGPDFFALGREFGRSRHLGAFVDGELVGCLGLALQRRFVGGEVRDIAYLYDLRVATHARRGGVCRELLRRARASWSEFGWAIATVLDGNPRGPAFTRGASAGARPLGSTLHVGVPLFVPCLEPRAAVVSVGPDEAWSAYLRIARGIDLAPAEPQQGLRADAQWLGIRRAGRLVATCQVVDQSGARRLRACLPPSAWQRLASLACRLRGRALLPGPGGEFRHACLAHCAAEAGLDPRPAFVAHLARSRGHDFSYAFFGVDPTAARRSRGPLELHLGSTTWSYGRTPAGLGLGFHELTLI